MLPGRVKSQFFLQARLISILCFASISCVETNFSTQEALLNYSTRDLSLGHYVSLLPGGISLEDISSGRLYAYGDLPQKLEDAPERKAVEKKTASHGASFLHKCKYCMQRRLKRSKMVNNTRRHCSNNVKRRYVSSRLTYLFKGMFMWPIVSDKFWISCYFGRRAGGRMHKGLDLAATAGTPVMASATGIVELATNAGTFGNMVLVKHRNGHRTRYAHMQSIIVHVGQFVPRGKLIGYVGNTGRVTGKTGNHLHFEVLVNHSAINPLRFLA